jgi:receptor expression-enhancing protein 1/2/3/4
VYHTFLRPFVTRHESDIDRNLNELRTRAGDVAFLWWQRGSVYAQTRFFELLQYVASQSNRPQQSSIPPPALASITNLATPKRPPAQGPPKGPPQVCFSITFSSKIGQFCV